MSTTTTPPPPGDAAPPTAAPTGIALRLGAPLLLVALGTLVIELGLTRLFSVVLFYHYAFLVISIALLGLACGGLAARFYRLDLDDPGDRRLMVRACIFSALLLVPILYLVLGTNIWLVTTWETFWRLSLLYVACMVPFAISGFVIAATLRHGSRHVARLYFYDLLGASVGCLLFVPLMNATGGPTTVLAGGLLWCLAGLTWALGSRGRAGWGEALAGVVALVALVAVNHRWDVLDVRYMRGAPRKAEVFSKWNSFSRVAVYPQASGQFWIEIDGGAGSAVANIDMDGPSGQWLRETLGSEGPGVAFWLSERPRSLVIGPGGGYDVARALAGGAPHVTAVEINPIIVRDVMLGEFRDASEGLYARKEVDVVVEDGRTFVHRTEETYDVVQLSQVDTWASSASGSYALTENYLYTVDAMEAYFGRLAPEGILSIGRWEFRPARETVRLVAVVTEALLRLGVPDPEKNVVVLMEDMDASGEFRMGTVLARKTPFPPSQLEKLARLPAGSGIHVAYAPGADGGEEPFVELVTTRDREGFFDRHPFNVRPVTDDDPFFFFTGRWSDVLDSSAFRDTTGDAVNVRAQFLLLALFGMALLAVLAFVLGPMLVARRTFAPAGGGVLPFLFFASAVGLGYILVEIALIQRFVVFLGQPVYSLTVVVFCMLLSSSLGSWVSGRFGGATLGRSARLAAFAVAGVLLGYTWLIPWVTASAQALSGSAKALIVACAVLPLGFLMGMPFPSGMRLTARTHPAAVEWFWALNAAATVLGSIGAILCFVVIGIGKTILLGGVIYAAAAVLLGRMR